MPEQKTHRVVKNPQMSARHLADYMAASDRAARTIIRNCKYQPIARVVQHDEAKAAVSKFIRDGESGDKAYLSEKVDALRQRLADSDFDRDLYDHNADYIERFSKVSEQLVLPDAEILAPGKCAAIDMKGVRVTADIQFRLRRLTKTNKIRVGAGMLRYAKGKPLPVAVAAWQSAFLFGYLHELLPEDGAEPERKLCLTVDAYEGVGYPAPCN